jgi:hypothetical protein
LIALTGPARSYVLVDRTLAPVERFWLRVDRSHGPASCWLWTAARRPEGYGVVWWNGRARRAHSVAWELSTGCAAPRLLDGRVLRHRCDNPPCCNPAHLVAGTCAENSRDMVDRGRDFRPNVRGQRNPNAKLSDDEVRWMRWAAAYSGVGSWRLSKAFGVSLTCAKGVLNGRRLVSCG